MKNYFITASIFLSCLSLVAQDYVPQKKSAIDLSIASNFDNTTAEALSWKNLYPIAIKKHFYLGFGIRATSAQINHQKFVTAPAKVSEGNFFKKQNELKLDSFFVPSSSSFAINTTIYMGYQVGKKGFFEFNIDFAGLSFGKKVTGTFESYSQGNPPSQQSAKVTPYNLLLTGDYDIGTLNSEFSFSYQLSDKVSIRPGISFIFVEYTTNNKLAFNNDRFRKKSFLPMLGVTYNL